MGVQIQFFTGVQENFDKLVENEKLVVGSLYFIKDTKRTYKAITRNTFDPIDEQIILVSKLPESGIFGKIYILRKLYPELYIWNGTDFIKMSIPSNVLYHKSYMLLLLSYMFHRIVQDTQEYLR